MHEGNKKAEVPFCRLSGNKYVGYIPRLNATMPRTVRTGSYKRNIDELARYFAFRPDHFY